MLKSLVAVTSVVGLMMITGRPAHADTRGTSRAMEHEAIKLVETIEEVGNDVRYHADRVAHFLTANVAVSEWSHYHHLEEIRDLVNGRLRPALKRLDEIQSALPEWKQESVDRMIAAARELSRDASSALMAKRKTTAVHFSLDDDYRALVRDLSTHSASLVTTAGAAHGYATARLKATDAGLLQSR